MEKVALPTIKFYSLRELLGDLLSFAKSDKYVSASCTFIEYVNSRKSHVGIGVDTKEAESKFVCKLIMIMGTLRTRLNIIYFLYFYR